MKKVKTILMALAVGFMALPVHAEVALPEDLGTTMGLSNQPISVIIGNLINVVLGVLGFVLVILIIYSGILWMTASGEDDKVKEAKERLLNSIIGLAIVLAAWAISNFVVDSLSGAVDGGGTMYP